MKTQMTFEFKSDPGHGWVVLRPTDLKKLGLSVDDFTEFSYVRKNGTVYAEEDCDGAIVMAAHHKKFGTWPVYTKTYYKHRRFLNGLYRCTGKNVDWKTASKYIHEALKG